MKYLIEHASQLLSQFQFVELIISVLSERKNRPVTVRTGRFCLLIYQNTENGGKNDQPDGRKLLFAQLAVQW